MAGERKGKTYEAIVWHALTEISDHVIKESLFWNETPNGMSIEPDIVIGPSKDEPTVLILITHGGSSKESNRKYWRNFAELYEAKTALKIQPIVISVIFDALIKDDIQLLESASFDHVLIVPNREYGKTLLNWVDDHLHILPKNDRERASEIATLRTKDRALGQALDRFEEDLKKALTTTNKSNQRFWTGVRQVARNSTNVLARITSASQGLNKLLLFEDIPTALKVFRNKRVPVDGIPQYAFGLGLLRKGIGRVYPEDKEIKNAVELFDDAQILRLIASAPSERISPWLDNLRDIGRASIMGDFVIDRLNDLKDPKFLHNCLVDSHANPDALIGSAVGVANWPPKNVWLLEFLVEAFKLQLGSATAFGYAKLAREVVAQGYGSERDLSDAGQFGGGFGLSAWLARNPKATLRPDLIEGVAAILSNRLREFSADDLRKLIEKLPQSMAKATMNKLLTKGFEPLYALVRDVFPQAEFTSIRSCFAEAAHLRGPTGKTRVAKIKNAIIKWQAVTSAGRDHKKKELCGRVVSMRSTWDDRRQKFVARANAEKFFLIVDGSWRQSDLDALVKAGWDAIFYPDELDKLAALIV
jgi:hypothetical protein